MHKRVFALLIVLVIVLSSNLNVTLSQEEAIPPTEIPPEPQLIATPNSEFSVEQAPLSETYSEGQIIEPELFIPTSTPVPTLEQQVTNLITNGDFSNGMNNWTPLNGLTHRINNGVFEFYRNTGAPSSDAAVMQTGFSAPGGELALSLDIGNISSTSYKIVRVILHKADWSDVRACVFTLAPNTSLKNFSIRTDYNPAWANGALSIYESSSDGAGWIQIDNVTLNYNLSDQVQGTKCYESGANETGLGTDVGNLVRNAHFSSSLPPWFTYSPTPNGILHNNGANGIFEFRRPAGSISAQIQQNTSIALAANTTVDLRLNLANTHGTPRRISVILHDSGLFGQMQFCSFWLSANPTTQLYKMETHIPVNWNAVSISIYDSDSGGTGWIQVDNVSLRIKPGLPRRTTYCNNTTSTLTNPYKYNIISSGMTWSTAEIQAINSGVNEVGNALFTLGANPYTPQDTFNQVMVNGDIANTILFIRMDSATGSVTVTPPGASGTVTYTGIEQGYCQAFQGSGSTSGGAPIP